MSIQPCNEPGCDAGDGRAGAIALRIESKARDLGDFAVRRLLPAPDRQRVGPFIFFDHMGPARFDAGQGVNVRPHPHIGLATVTYLFEGVILHRDSLGFVQPITPGAVNWMTAGRGIVHSERTPPELRAKGSRLHGMQVWLALPHDREEVAPSFVHHAAGTLPEIEQPGVALQLIAGSAYGERSPVVTASEMFYLAGRQERAVYVIEGEVAVAGESVGSGTMAVLRPGSPVPLEARGASRVALLGGAPIPGERHLWWNFVSSSAERIERAKADWAEGRFPAVPDESEFIPLPEDPPTRQP